VKTRRRADSPPPAPRARDAGAFADVVVIQKRTSYRRFVLEKRDRTVQGLLRDRSPAVRTLRSSHDDHEATCDAVADALRELGVTAEIRSVDDEAPIVGARLVVTVGGDGTLLAASHLVGSGVPIVGINSSPTSSVGFFCAGRKGSERALLSAALSQTLKQVHLTRMWVERNGVALSARVLNEALFCHASPAATSRYILRLRASGRRAVEEEQRSSGLWIGPAAGSTAAQRSAGGRVLPLGSPDLQFVVREPYTPLGKTLAMRKGLVAPGGRLELVNKMHEAKIFLDGQTRVFDVRYGDEIVMRASPEPLTVLGLVRRKW
jgi:NAD+ kinase